MKIGIVFPQTEIGDDPDVVANYAQSVEALGYDHLLAFDHVLGAGRGTRPDWQGPYDSESLFHEPMVLYGYLAGLTTTLELVTAVLILPQRQTALVAKQAACVDVLSRGRLRLGIGTGWNDVEYQALGENFHDRGRRSEEQIDLLRALWADPTITFDGRWHTIVDAGLKPLPGARSIPVWLGGMADAVIERVGRLADGWFPFFNPDLSGQIARMHEHAKAAGRDPASIGIEVMQGMNVTADQVKALQDLGVTHVAVTTMNQNLEGAGGHLDAVKRAYDVLGPFSQ